MTSKFKVGDKVKVVRDVNEHRKGQIKTIKSKQSPESYFEYSLVEGGYINGTNLELVESKPTKNQRITTLEETVAKQGEEINELKLIVEQIRKPSTVVEEALANVENIIEFEGKQYKKVEREALEGDVVVLKGSAQSKHIRNGKPYKTFIGRYGFLAIQENDSDHIKLYSEVFKRTPETVDVYELIVEDKHDVPPNEWPPDYPFEKSPNQLRAEIIEKAKGFVDSLFKKHWNCSGDLVVAKDGLLYDVQFVIKKNEKQVNALLRVYGTKDRPHVDINGKAKCNPSDVFNEHIGKAIALGRALGLDVSEFEQAVQPSEHVIGHVVVREDGYEQEVKQLSYNRDLYRIINDTNAIYGGVE